MKVIISTINNAHKLNKCDLFMVGTNFHFKLINLLSCFQNNCNSLERKALSAATKQDTALYSFH